MTHTPAEKKKRKAITPAIKNVFIVFLLFKCSPRRRRCLSFGHKNVSDKILILEIDVEGETPFLDETIELSCGFSF